jgi:hypothetical protein
LPVTIDVFGGVTLPAQDWFDSAFTLRPETSPDAIDVTRSLTVDDVQEKYVLSPTKPLADGWYTLDIVANDDMALPSQGARDYGPPGPDDVGNGKLQSHFRVGSEPHLLAVSACASMDASLYPKLLVSYSEVVDVPDPPPIAVTADGKATPCTVNEPPSKENPVLELTCQPAIPARSKLTVTLSAGIVASTSALPVQLGGSDPDSRTIDVPEPTTGAVCRTWRELELH